MKKLFLTILLMLQTCIFCPQRASAYHYQEVPFIKHLSTKYAILTVVGLVGLVFFAYFLYPKYQVIVLQHKLQLQGAELIKSIPTDTNIVTQKR